MPKFKIKIVYEFEHEATYDEYNLEGEQVATLEALQEALEENLDSNPIDDFDCGIPEITVTFIPDSA